MTQIQLPLVDKHQAPRLKKAGFDWHTIDIFDFNGDPVLLASTEGFRNCNKSVTISRPTLAQAHMWFRQERGISIDVSKVCIGTNWSCMIKRIEPDGRAHYLLGKSILADDYDSALSAGISKALDIIEEQGAVSEQ